MDVLQEANFAVKASNLEQFSRAEENESHEGIKLKPCSPTPAPTGNNPTGSHGCERTPLSPSCPLPPAEASDPNANGDSSHHAISLTSHTTGVSPWSPLGDCCDKAGFTMMEPGSASALSGDCLLQQSRTCLGCFIETKDATEPEPDAVLGSSREYDDACPVSDMAIQCLSSGDRLSYGDQLLSDQLLSYPALKTQVSEKRGEKSPVESDSEDAAAKSIYDGLLLDKCNGEEALLTNSNQDWGCFESFISESKIDLLDLCSKNELSVNLFTEEDVGNYMFDDEDEDSTLGSDVCSLKIRYESFQDNVREKTTAIQEQTQFSFFPSVVAKKEGEVEVVTGAAEGLQIKEKVKVWPDGENIDKNSSGFAEGMPNDSLESSYLFDLNNLTEDSGEYSDDSSCTGSLSDTCQTKRKHCLLSRENFGSSTNPSYGLRSKRKVSYREDYLYNVDFIENERNTEKRDKQAAGLKKEKDDDWCPKKRRRSSRKEPPVIIKYIIINRFKGDKHMSVKIGKINTSETTVSLSKDLVHKYQRLAPLKDYWQQRQREMLELQRLAAGDKNKCLNSCRRSLKSKRRYRIANRIQIQRIPAVEHLPSLRHYKTEVCATEESVCSDTTTIIMQTADCAARLDKGGFAGKSRSHERETMRRGNTTMKIRKFKSAARLLCGKIKDVQQGSDKIALGPASPHQSLVNKTTAGPQICDGSAVHPPKEPSPSPCCSPSSTVSVNVDTALPVIPGGYLQTLLDVSDSPSNTGISYYPQEHSRQFAHGIPEESQFPVLQLPHSCVLSPPSETELQESPSNQIEPNFPPAWLSGADKLPFTSVIPPDSDIIGAGYSSAMPLPVTDDMPVSVYGQVNVDDSGLLYDKDYLSEKLPELQSDILPREISAEEEHKQLCTIGLSADNGRLVGYDSVGSHSVTSGDYTSLSLQACEKDGEEDRSETFLAHCSPKLVIQQSTKEIGPFRESTDLLDISNFTPDKFRHSSVSEMSPPDTPNLSPQVVGAEMRESQGKGREFQETDMTFSVSPDGNWKCNVLQNPGAGAMNNQQLQFDTYNCVDDTGLTDKRISAETIECSTNAPKFKGKTNTKHNLGQAKSPRVAKTERSKSPRQNSRSSKKVKALLQAETAQGANQPMLDLDRGGLAGCTEDWAVPGEHGGSWTDGSSHTPGDDHQREFEEPSNILSNIVSGMAEVQRFMKVSVEPLWDLASGLCQPPEANSLKTKTLKILAATAPDFRKKAGHAACPGAGRGRKTAGRGAKNQAKVIPSNPFFPPLTLDCNMFNKSSLGICGPAHKKMYCHKTSAKFARDENNTGKKDLSKNVVLMASYEKRR